MTFNIENDFKVVRLKVRMSAVLKLMDLTTLNFIYRIKLIEKKKKPKYTNIHA